MPTLESTAFTGGIASRCEAIASMLCASFASPCSWFIASTSCGLAFSIACIFCVAAIALSTVPADSW